MASAKHSVYPGHLELFNSCDRIVILFRHVITHNQYIAKQHYLKCNNVESWNCKCNTL